MGWLWDYWLVYAVGGVDWLMRCRLVDAVVEEVGGLRKNWLIDACLIDAWLIDAVDEKG